jgi:hypothetical protein
VKTVGNTEPEYEAFTVISLSKDIKSLSIQCYILHIPTVNDVTFE